MPRTTAHAAYGPARARGLRTALAALACCAALACGAAAGAPSPAHAAGPSLQADGAEVIAIPEGEFTADGIRYQVEQWDADGSCYALVCGATDELLATGKLVIPDEVASPLGDGTTFHVAAVKQAAFMNCTTLKSVEFAGTMGGRIGGAAFYGCTALQRVTFANDCTLGRKGLMDTGSNGNPIGGSAFAACTALETIQIPAITSAVSKDKDAFTMAVSHWHGEHTPVATNGSGISVGAFANCPKLASIVFRAGNAQGAYAYFNTSGSNFLGCTGLAALVFEAEQPYWLDPHSETTLSGGGWNGWDWNDATNPSSKPDLYYAVDYYASEAAALADDALETPDRNAPKRLARVEYERGTQMAGIAAGTAEPYAHASEYAQAGYADGTAPDAAAAAGHAGESGWVWKFEQPYGFNDALYESCYAYPAKATDLSAAHVSAAPLDEMRTVANRFMEPWLDIERYTRAAGVENSLTDDARAILYLYRTGGYTESAAFTKLLSGGFEEPVAVMAADGTPLEEGADYTVAFKRYDEAAKKLTGDMATPDGAGPYLMRIVGASGSPYAGTALELWIRVKAHALSFSTTRNTGADAGAAALMAGAIGTGTTYGNKSAPYAVLVDDTRPDMLYLGSAFAGFADAVMVPTTDGEYGAALGVIGTVLGESATKRVLAIGVSRATALEVESKGAQITPERYDLGSSVNSMSKLAVAAYQDFNANARRYGVAGRSWGDVAVLLPPGLPADCAAMAAYAYAVKAPVFFAEDDGSVSADTLKCLADFGTVALAGGEDVTPASVEQALAGAGLAAQRVGTGADGQCDFSIAVTRTLADAGAASFATASVVAGSDPFDICCGIALSGYRGGVVLVTGGTGDSKRIVSQLAERETADKLNRFYLAEPAESVFANDAWDFAEQARHAVAGEETDTALAAGDVFSAAGCTFELAGDGRVALLSRYGTAATQPDAGGTVRYDGADYTVASVGIGAVELSGVAAKTYTGKALTQALVLTWGGRTLAEGTDYTLAYQGNKNAGTATLTIAGTGAFSGERSATFTIKKAAQPLKASAKAATVKAAKAKKKAVKLKPVSVTGAKGSVSYAKKSGAKQLAVNAKTGAVTVKKGTKKGTYQAKVTVKAAKTANYKAATKTVTVKVTVK